jgi:hypothetical protein
MEIITIGLDLAKSAFPVHGVHATGHAMVRKKLAIQIDSKTWPLT